MLVSQLGFHLFTGNFCISCAFEFVCDNDIMCGALELVASVLRNEFPGLKSLLLAAKIVDKFCHCACKMKL